MEWYRRGNWVVGTPIWTDPEGFTGPEVIAKMICPHPSWTIQEAGRAEDPSTEPPTPIKDPASGDFIWNVAEHCALCDAIRFRWIPETLKNEPFDYTVPQAGPWYERLYNLGNFVILARRYQNNPNVPPSFMTRVETEAGHVHTGMVQIPTLLFSPSALDQIADMERMMRLGPQKYIKLRALKEGKTRRDQLKDLEAHATTLAQVVQDVGAESVEAARAIFEAEIEHETAEAEEYQIKQMEDEVTERKREREERKKKRSK